MDKIKFGKIHDVVITDLELINDERGAVLHMLRLDDPVFRQFGEIYFSKVFPGAVKAWKLHKRMTLNLAVPVGKVKLVLYDDRTGSKTRGIIQEIILSEKDYKLVSVPPLIWSGFTAIGGETALLANCASIPHDPAEKERMDPFDNDIPYDWKAEYGK